MIRKGAADGGGGTGIEMRKKDYRRAFAAGLAGVMLIVSGCGQTAAGTEISPAQTSAAETKAAEESAPDTAGAENGAEEAGVSAAEEGGEAAATGGETSDLSANPGAVWFDKDTGEAHGNIADTSTTEAAQPGEEVDVMAPVHAWGEIVSVEGDSITVNRMPEASDSDGAGVYPEETIIHIDPEHSVVVDAVNGLPVELSDLKEGESFEAYLGPAMSMSLPPQVTAYAVIVSIPEDFKAPVFVIAADAVLDTDNGKLLDAYGDQDYMLADDVEVQPYLTRNIVTLDDIQEGSCCLAWTNEYDMITKLVLFAAE